MLKCRHSSVTREGGVVHGFRPRRPRRHLPATMPRSPTAPHATIDPAARGRRVLVIGRRGAHRTEASIVRALRSVGASATQLSVDGGGRLPFPIVTRLVDAWTPDTLVLTRHALRLGVDRLAHLARDRRVITWYVDFRWPDDSGIVPLAPITDLLYLTYASLLAPFRAAGFRDTRFLPQGMDPELDRPVGPPPDRFACEVAFIGSGQYPHRWPLLERLAGTTRLQVRGPYWDDAPSALRPVSGRVLGRAFARAVNEAAVTLGANALPRLDQEPIGMSNRIWKVMGCGGVYLGPWVPRAAELAVHDEHCLWYRDADDAVALVQAVSADPARRARLALAGRAHALAHHTYARRMHQLLRGESWGAASGDETSL